LAKQKAENSFYTLMTYQLTARFVFLEFTKGLLYESYPLGALEVCGGITCVLGFARILFMKNEACEASKSQIDRFV
jgi:hypothetical protein